MICREKEVFIQHLRCASMCSCFAFVALFNSQRCWEVSVIYACFSGEDTDAQMLRKVPKSQVMGPGFPLDSNRLQCSYYARGHRAIVWIKIKMGSLLFDCSQSNRDGQIWKVTRSPDKMQMITVIKV